MYMYIQYVDKRLQYNHTRFQKQHGMLPQKKNKIHSQETASISFLVNTCIFAAKQSVHGCVEYNLKKYIWYHLRKCVYYITVLLNINTGEMKDKSFSIYVF